jgi:hypothetical protein
VTQDASCRTRESRRKHNRFLGPSKISSGPNLEKSKVVDQKTALGFRGLDDLTSRCAGAILDRLYDTPIIAACIANEHRAAKEAADSSRFGWYPR